MERNVLEEGNPRLGWLVDGDPSTPEIAVMLCDTGSRIELTVPTRSIGVVGPYDNWFMPCSSVPNVLLVEDDQGSVVLVGCRDAGHVSGLPAGRGRIVADFAVLGARSLQYNTINGFARSFPR
jgi:hypothetical protein